MRLIVYLVAILQVANGLFMLFLPHDWYLAVPGVIETGPFNQHFVRDIGLGFLAAGSALWLAAGQPALTRPLVLVASVFLFGHALLHLAEIVTGGSGLASALRDIALIVLPATLPLVALRKAVP